MTEIAICLLPLGVAAILRVVLGHLSTMAHLQARREGSLDRDEYKRGVHDGMLRAAKMLAELPATPSSYTNMIRAAVQDG